MSNMTTMLLFLLIFATAVQSAASRRSFWGLVKEGSRSRHSVFDSVRRLLSFPLASSVSATA